MRKLARSVGEMTKRLEKDAGPVMERAKGVAENVEFITAAIRTDVQKLNASVAGLNERLREASAHMEERIQDFTALVEVLLEVGKACAGVIATADSAVLDRGVRWVNLARWLLAALLMPALMLVMNGSGVAVVWFGGQRIASGAFLTSASASSGTLVKWPPPSTSR